MRIGLRTFAISVVTLLASTSVSFADSCTPVDYRSQLGPNRDQGSTGWCFAYSTADLITQRSGHVISALDIGTSYYIENVSDLATRAPAAVKDYYNANAVPALMIGDRNDASIAGAQPVINKVSGGQEDGAILMANVKGLCAEADLPSDGGFSGADAKTLKSLTALATKTPSSCKNYPLSPGGVSHLDTPVADCVNEQWLIATNSRCRRISYSQPLLPDTLRVAIDLPTYRSLVAAGKINAATARAQLMAKLNATLSAGKIASIGYNGNLMWGLNVKSINGDHASPVVARRSVRGVCQYLVRDSFGTSCSIYGSKFSGPDRCESGNIWLTEDELAGTSQLYSVISLK